MSKQARTTRRGFLGTMAVLAGLAALAPAVKAEAAPAQVKFVNGPPLTFRENFSSGLFMPMSGPIRVNHRGREAGELPDGWRSVVDYEGPHKGWQFLHSYLVCPRGERVIALCQCAGGWTFTHATTGEALAFPDGILSAARHHHETGLNRSGTDTFIISETMPESLGMIALWAKPVAEIPSGWRLCDGANGTPDLRGRLM